MPRINKAIVRQRRESVGPRRIAEVLGVSLPTVYRLIRAGDIPAYRVRRALRVTVANLLAYRRANRLVKDCPRIADRQARAVSTDPPVDR